MGLATTLCTQEGVMLSWLRAQKARHWNQTSGRARTYRPQLEALEDRRLLIVFTWVVDGIEGNWTNQNNWAPVGYPGYGDTAIFNGNHLGWVQMDLPASQGRSK